MCNGESGRLSHGGVIVILKPTEVPGSPALKRELSLRLADDASKARTLASLQGLESEAGLPIIIIQYFCLILRRAQRSASLLKDCADSLDSGLGDLRAARNLDEAVLHQFIVPESMMTGRSFPLSNKLNLSVGGDGVIGHRASFVRDGTTLAEGIIGWN